jgi:D-glycero-alpha-D-manno-heptose-7-phosphate kinase
MGVSSTFVLPARGDERLVSTIRTARVAFLAMATLVRAKAPLRISFAGGGTDVPPFPEREGGAVLSSTINRYAWGTLKPRDDGQICINSLDFGLSLAYASREDLDYDGEMDLAKAAIKRLAGDHSVGYDLFLHTDAPPGSGLGSSSAMMVALVGLLNEFHGLGMNDYEIADTAYSIERVDLGIKGGMQDQYAAAFGGFNYIEFLGDRVLVNGLKVSRDILNELEYGLLLGNTGKVRLSSHIIDDQVRRYEEGDADANAALREIKALTTEMKTALLHRRMDEFGRLLDLEWQHKRRMSARISSPELDELYEAARRAGAIGGKITGAGGGGYMLLYCQFDRKHAIRDRLREMGVWMREVSLEPLGLQTWRVNDFAVR